MRVYADNAATTRLNPKAKEAMLDYYSTVFGNPSSVHSIGIEAAEALRHSRKNIADLMGCSEEEIYFTSGGSESNNQAIFSAAEFGYQSGKKHIVTTAIEHPSVHNVLKKLKNFGFEVTLLDVDKSGIITTEQVEAAIRHDTCLVTVMYANNEIGTIQPISEIASMCEQKGILFHTDAVQAVGHLDIDCSRECFSMLSASAHKFHGPKGIGLLYCQKGVNLTKLIEGGSQECGKRAGTENVPAIVGMAVALKEALMNLEERVSKTKYLRNFLLSELLGIDTAFLNGDLERRLSGNINICFPGQSGEGLLLYLNGRGICVSTGSACSTGSVIPSHVLTSMSGEEVAKSSVRISLSEENSIEEMEYMVSVIREFLCN